MHDPIGVIQTGVLALAACLAGAATLEAQTFEVTPFGGYRFGGDFFELLTAQPIDLDGAATLGVVVNVPLSEDVQIEALVSHQRARLVVPAAPSAPAALWAVSVDHWLGGGLQEFGGGRARPFLTGMLGLTRYAAAGDSEIRFTVGAGGGVKLFPTTHIGVRLDGRAFLTIVDAGGTVYACAPGRCLLALHADIAWQGELTTGLVIRFR